MTLPHVTRAAAASGQMIRFSDWFFTSPTPLRVTYRPSSLRSIAKKIMTTEVPEYGGLYAIMVPDATWGPLPYRPIYFGEAESLAERVCSSHEKYPSWIRAAAGAQLFVAFHAVTTSLLRRVREKRLIEHYNPECNKIYNAFAARTLGDLA